jgi:hypothetical protein
LALAVAGALGASAANASAATAAELHDPRGGLRLGLDAPGVRVCVIEPVAMRDPASCEGIDVEAARAKTGKVAADPSAQHLLYAVVQEQEALSFLHVARYEAGDTTQGVARELLQSARAGVKPPAVIVEDAGTEPTPKSVGDVSGWRAVLRVDRQPGGDALQRLTTVYDVLPGLGCIYVLQLGFPTVADARGFAYENALLAKLTLDKPPGASTPDGGDAHGTRWALPAIIASAVVGAGVVLVVRRRRRRAG